MSVFLMFSFVLCFTYAHVDCVPKVPSELTSVVIVKKEQILTGINNFLTVKWEVDYDTLHIKNKYNVRVFLYVK